MKIPVYIECIYFQTNFKPATSFEFKNILLRQYILMVLNRLNVAKDGNYCTLININSLS